MKIKGRDLKPIRHTVRVNISVGNNETSGDLLTDEVRIVYRGITGKNSEIGGNWVDKFCEEKYQEYVTSLPEDERKVFTEDADAVSTKKDRIGRIANLTWMIVEFPDFADDKDERYRLLKDDGMPNGRAFDILEGLEQKDCLRIYGAIMEDIVPNEKGPGSSQTSSEATT